MSRGDVWTIEAFLRALVAIRPRRATLENVIGFLRKDRQGNGSPLMRFLQRFIELGLEQFYFVVIIFAPGNTRLPFLRRRIFINFYDRLEEDVEESMELRINLTQDT